MTAAAPKNPSELIWQFLDGLPETIRENFMSVVALAICKDEDAINRDWDFEGDVRKFLRADHFNASSRAAIAIGILELHFARPGLPSDNEFVEEMDSHGSEHLSAIVRRQPLIARHKKSAEREWRLLRENPLSFQALVVFEMHRPLPLGQ